MTPKYNFLKKILFVSFLIIVFSTSLWYFLQTPQNDRNWSLDQAVLPYAQIDGTEVKVFNIRNFTYTSESDYVPDYYDQTYDLDELVSVDFIVEPFDDPGAAHTFLSFGFSNGKYLAISAEIRKEKGETFSPLLGLLRRFELMYVVADERDVVKLRTNYRKDIVYLYLANISLEKMRQLFVDMLTRANTLKNQPEFYNTLTNTCTTNIVDHINKITPNKISWDLRLLLPKNSDELAYELGLIGNTQSLAELRQQHQINDLAEKYADNPDFSKLIRKNILAE